jgi:nucleoside-triphosphatase
MGRALLLTGRPGVGKTTVIRSVVAQLGARAGGFYTEEIRESGRRTGFRLVTLDGSTGTLADLNISGPYRVGRYGVHLSNLEQVGVAALWAAIRQPEVSVVVIDEIGKMELFSTAFCQAVLAALDSPKTVLASVMARSHPWVDAIKARHDVKLVEATQANRQDLPEQIVRWMQQTGAFQIPGLEAPSRGRFLSRSQLSKEAEMHPADTRSDGSLTSGRTCGIM